MRLRTVGEIIELDDGSNGCRSYLAVKLDNRSTSYSFARLYPQHPYAPPQLLPHWSAGLQQGHLPYPGVLMLQVTPEQEMFLVAGLINLSTYLLKNNG